MLKPRAIGFDGEIVIDAARHIRPVAGLDLAMRRLFEIHHVECVLGIADDIGGALGVEGHHASPQRTAMYGLPARNLRKARRSRSRCVEEFVVMVAYSIAIECAVEGNYLTIA